MDATDSLSNTTTTCFPSEQLTSTHGIAVSEAAHTKLAQVDKASVDEKYHLNIL